VANLPPVSKILAANFANFMADVVVSGGKFATGVNDTQWHIATGINATSSKLAMCVNDTGGKELEQYRTAHTLN
jgi:hypothetical protein